MATSVARFFIRVGSASFVRRRRIRGNHSLRIEPRESLQMGKCLLGHGAGRNGFVGSVGFALGIARKASMRCSKPMETRFPQYGRLLTHPTLRMS